LPPLVKNEVLRARFGKRGRVECRLDNHLHVLEAIQFSVRPMVAMVGNSRPTDDDSRRLFCLQRCGEAASFERVVVARTLPPLPKRFNAPLGKRLRNHIIFVMID
jgi:hypothetical protein